VCLYPVRRRHERRLSVAVEEWLNSCQERRCTKIPCQFDPDATVWKLTDRVLNRSSLSTLTQWLYQLEMAQVMTGFYTFTPAIFHACHLVQPSGRGEYEISDAIDLLLQSGRTIDAIRMNGWRVDVGYPEDRDRAESRLQGESLQGDIEATPDTESVVDGNTSTE